MSEPLLLVKEEQVAQRLATHWLATNGNVEVLRPEEDGTRRIVFRA